jgi:hypothetical protein
MTEDKVLQLVREQLVKYSPGGVCIALIDGRVWRGEHGWHVGVSLSKEPEDLYIVYTALAKIEETLAEKAQVEVHFRISDPVVAAEERPDHPVEADAAT